MDHYSYTTSLAFLSLVVLLIHISLRLFQRASHHKLPPGPRPWPIVGNLPLLGGKPHRSVAALSKAYGPVMRLELGPSSTTIVVSSPEAAREMFLHHDLLLSSRRVPDVGTVARHDQLSVVFLPVGPTWRRLRKIAALQLLTNRQLDACQGLRLDKVGDLVAFCRRCCEVGMAVDVGKAAFTTTLNMLSNTFFSADLSSLEEEESSTLRSREFKEIIWRVLEETGRPNVSDLFPLVRALDLQGVRRRYAESFNKMLGVFERIIDERLLSDEKSSNKDDVLGTLLELYRQDELTLDHVKHLLVNLFIGGTDTSSNTLEWAMAELLRQPEKIERAQLELGQVVSKGQLVQESHITKLPYIQAIVKETLRLHPSAPFLVPRKATQEVQLCGYRVPKGADIWVNVWAIGRDPGVWPDPDSFSPERFVGAEIDVRGTDFRLLPFGAGRRMCPGISLAHRMLHLLLANLLHSFDWKLGDGLGPKDVDMEEKFGVGIQKLHPLKLIPMPR